MNKFALKEAFEVESKHGAFYTGGEVQWSVDGEYIFCQRGGAISVLSINKGSVVSHVGQTEVDEIEDTIHTFTISKNNDHLIVHHKSSLFKLWNWKDCKLIKIWKSIHKGPVARIALSNDNLMASGGSDGTVRLWNLEHHTCTHNLKGVQGVVSALAFHPNTEKELLFAAGDDSKIHGWNIKSGKELVTLSGHFSKVTSLSFHTNGKHLVSSGRDRVLILWNIVAATSMRVLPVYEGIEGAFIIPKKITLPELNQCTEKDIIYVAAAGEKGTVKIWEMKTGRQVYTQSNSMVSAAKEEGSLSIVNLLYNSRTNSLAIVSVDHNILIHSLETFECTKQLVGYSDEILDIVYLGVHDSHLAVATNSSDIKIYDLLTMNCQLLSGHTDIVLSLGTTSANVYLLVSAAKDNSVRVWLMDKETAKVSCIASAVRHTAPVGSVALTHSSCKFFASVSQDLCLKLWELPESLELRDADSSLNAMHTVQAHQKVINCVTVSPNDKLVATGSQDKTAKLWSTDNLQLLGVFNGHRRGVWFVRFSPIDQVLLTTSADCTIKLWSLTELNCLKTLEGHESSVLRAEFLSRGMQLITAGGDGLLKLWSIKTSECLCTLEEHESRVWTLAVSKNEKHIISAGNDSSLVIWKDVTEEKRTKLIAEKEQLAVEEQKLSNLLKANKLKAALKLALKLGRPLQVLKIMEGILVKGNETFIETIQDLKPTHKEELLKHAVTWNTNSRNCQVAQMVINALMLEIGSEELHAMGLATALESMIPYTERHFKRMTKLLQDLHLFTYTVNHMKSHIASIGTN